MAVLRFTSCQAEIAEPSCEALARFLSECTGISCEYVGDIPWQERARLLDRGEIQAGWICGLAYIRRRDTSHGNLELLAAPVRSHPRYAGRPIYFSDVVVRNDSSFKSFGDLRGATCAYNEPESHSGCNILRYHLAQESAGGDFFARIVQSGSHHNSIRMLLDGHIDVAAIDSTVLELELAADPAVAPRLRTIASLGPSPAPPWVIHASVPQSTRKAVRQAMLEMHTSAHGQQLLAAARMLRFAAVDDGGYDAIREMDRLAATINFHCYNPG